MIKSLFLINLRTATKNFFFFALNTIGLSIGIAACLLCLLHIEYERSYDSFHSNSDQIFRLVTGDVADGSGWVKVSAPIPPLLKDEIPEVQNFSRLARITYNPKITVQFDDKIFNEDKFFMADPAILKIFNFPLESGNKEKVLVDLNRVLLSHSAATKYFGDEDPIGKNIRVNDQFDFEVEGVFSDVPVNSHMDFDFLISFQNLERVFPGTSLSGNWGQFNYYAYLRLYEVANIKAAEEKIREIKVDIGEESEFELSELGLQALGDIHFQDNRGNLKASYNPRYLYIYAAIALAILLISFINFVNLGIAGSTKRIKEVGVRKVMGASRSQLIFQFILESTVVTFVALVLSLVLTDNIFLPLTNSLLNSSITIDYLEPVFIFSMLLLLALISISSGAYMAFFVSSFKPVEAFKGDLRIGSKGSVFKNLLLGIQFSISIMLIFGSVFIYQQLLFLKNKDIGMDTNQVVNIALYNKVAREKAQLLKASFSQFTWINSISASRFTAGAANWNQTVWWEGQEEDVSMFLIMADRNIVDVLDLELVEGEKSRIEAPMKEGETRYLLNESAVELIGWENAVGQSFTAFGQNRIQTVFGVVKDYNFRSLHHNVAPCALVVTESLLPSNLLVKFQIKDYKMALGELEQKFGEIVPDTPFEYTFLDDEFGKLYEAENRTAKIVGFLTVIAIVLALLGLYGLLTFVVQERTKEMAIRKVLGVQLRGIIYLLSNDFMKLLLIANIIAIPVVWVVISNWLNSFNYRIDINPGLFLAASSVIWVFVFLIIGLNVLQVSKIDPIKGLKYE